MYIVLFIFFGNRLSDEETGSASTHGAYVSPPPPPPPRQSPPSSAVHNAYVMPPAFASLRQHAHQAHNAVTDITLSGGGNAYAAVFGSEVCCQSTRATVLRLKCIHPIIYCGC